jgi:hypothetical protein
MPPFSIVSLKFSAVIATVAIDWSVDRARTNGKGGQPRFP